MSDAEVGAVVLGMSVSTFFLSFFNNLGLHFAIKALLWSLSCFLTTDG